MAYVLDTELRSQFRAAARSLASATAAALICFACGGDPATSDAEPDAEAPVANRAPNLGRIMLEPQNPTRADVLSLMVEVNDPERDAVEIQADWFRNGILLKSGSELKLPASQLQQGDEIFARVQASDQNSTVKGESPRVRVGNSPPRISSLRVLPANPSGADNLMATVESVDAENDEVDYRFEWSKNSEPIRGENGPTLDASKIARGDEIHVSVIPVDRASEGEPMRSAPVKIQNAAPLITSEPTYDAAGPDLSEYRVIAEDPDGDRPLRYELVEAPQGMEIDIVSGQLSWRVPEGAAGNHTIEISVQDPHGGEAHQRYVIDLQWAAPQAPDEQPPPAADAQ